MKAYCKYTRIELVREDLTTGLGIKGKDYIVASSHPLFNKALHVVVQAAEYKHISDMSANQRYLLSTVLAKKSGLFTIRFPLNREILNDETCLKILPVLTAAANRILVNGKQWKELLYLLPKMEIREDNCNNFNWEYMAKQVILKSTGYLSSANAESRLQARLVSSNLTETSLESEHNLFHTIKGTAKKGKELPFNIHHAKTVMVLLDKALKENSKPPIPEVTKGVIIKLFITKPERITIPVKEIISIKTAMTHWLAHSIEETSIIHRESYFLTVKKLEEILVSLQDKATMFDDVFSGTKKDIEFKIESTKPEITAELIEETQRINPALAKLMAMQIRV